MQWQADVGPVPHHIGGLVLLGADGRPRPDVLAGVLAERLGRVPALRHRPVAAAVGGGGWYWLEDDTDPASHVTTTTVGATGTEALLDAATASLTTPARPAAPRTLLNRPTGPRRRLHLVEVDETAVRAGARALAASVNDLILVAAVEALRAAAADAGEELDQLTVSVPVAVPADGSAAAANDTGVGPRNAVGVLQMAVPATGPLTERVGVVTRRRKERLAGDHGRSLPLVLLAFRVLRAAHLVGWFLDRQRLVNTLVTAVPAIRGPVRIVGAKVATLIPLVPNQGNTTAAFATTRYAGQLVIAVTTDPDVGPDGAVLAERLHAALVTLTPQS
jgi:diacylglycerol O-acyltransferase